MRPTVSHDSLLGGDGNDELRGRSGADVLSGQAGIDTASYTEKSHGVRVTLDYATNNDGEAGEGDTVRPDIEIVRGGHGNDEIVDQVGLANSFNGGPGVDRLVGGAGADMLFSGGSGKTSWPGYSAVDLLVGESGNDLLIGGNDADRLVGGAGADDLYGGGGPSDAVVYSASTQPVTVDLDGAFGDDGAAGEGDTVRSDVENIVGSPFSDTLTGNAGANDIYGGDGDDTIEGGLGTDWLIGENGNDTLRSKDDAWDMRVDCGPDSDHVDADKIDDPIDCEAS